MSNSKIPKLRLDPHSGNTLLLIGASMSGKTTVMLKLYDKYYNNKKYISTLFAANPQIELYKGREKYLLVATGFDSNHETYIQSQKYINTKTSNKYDFCQLIDDNIDLRNSKLLANLILSYRNSHISSMICMQAVKILTPAVRSNVHNLIFLWFNNEESIEQVVAIYLRDYFKRLGWHKSNYTEKYRDLTRDHNHIYLHVLSETLWSSRYGNMIVDGVVV